MITYNGNIMKVSGYWLTNSQTPDPYNPLGLPPYTIRVRLTAGAEPLTHYIGLGTPTAVQVYADPNVWDVTLESPDWSDLFTSESIVEVLGANTTGVENMSRMFEYCSALTTLCLFDTSSVESFYLAFASSNITAIPLYPTDSLVDAYQAFSSCYNVETGSLALYQQMSTQANPPTYHDNCFADCGSGTVTGAAELEQIPADWK